MAADKKDIVLFIGPSYEPNTLKVLAVNYSSRSPAPEFCMDIRNVTIFFKTPPKFFKEKVKSVILCVFDFQHSHSTNNIEFRRMITKCLESHGIKYTFIDSIINVSSNILVGANLTPKIGEILLLVTTHSDSDDIDLFEYQQNENGYVLINHRFIENSTKLNLIEIRKKILGNTKPNETKIILAPTKFPACTDEIFKRAKAAMKNDKPIIVPFANLEYTLDAAIEMTKNLFDPNYTKFHIIPQCIDFLAISNMKEITCDEDCLIQTNLELLPLSETKVVKRSNFPFYLANCTNKKYKRLCTKELPTEPHHRLSITLKVDLKHNYHFTQEPIILQKVMNLPQKLNEKLPSISKIPVIGFFDNSSVICLWNEKINKYEFLEEWGDLYLDFSKPKPIFDSKVLIKNDINPKSIVFDVLRLISMPVYDLHTGTDWEFVIKSDNAKRIYIEIENFEGKNQAEAPSFFMALLLKHHLKAIKKKMGVYPGKLAFCFFDDFNVDQRKRVERGMKKACNLLEIDYAFLS